MSPLKISLLAVLMTVLLTSAGQYHLQQGRREEADRLRWENHQLRLKVSQRRQAQLAKAEPANQGDRSNTVSSLAPSETSLVDRSNLRPAKVSPVPGTEYRNEGQATPVAALQTLAWACDHGDAALMQKLIVFDADARGKTAAHFASLPPDERPVSVSFEAVAADLYISDGLKHPYPVADVLQLANFESINPERVVLRMPGANGNGYEFQRTAEGWKLAVTMKVVDDYIKETAEPAGRP